MSTVCKIALCAPADRVSPILDQFLRTRGSQFEVTESEWPAACEHETFNASEAFPSIFSVKQVTPQVCEIHFNSFAKVADLASHLSARAGADVVVNIYQSASTASHWALYSRGQLRRAVEAGDGEVYGQSGQSLPFEYDQPGRPIGDEGETIMIFDHPEQDWYNREVGVPVEVYQQYDSSWSNFLLGSGVSESRSMARNLKSWWRFW
jgi:hypothetical protein